MSGAASSSDADDPLRECRAAARRRLRERVGAIIRTIRVPLADVLRDQALVHLPPAAAARLRAVHPSWSRTLASPLFAVAHAAAPRRLSGLFGPHPAGFVPLDAADTIPSPPFASIPASSELAVLASSHGLACCFSLLDDAYFVCNPATSSWTAVPSPPSRAWPRPAVVVLFNAGAYNFRGDYALVCAFESAPGLGTYCFAVFTSGAGAWWVPDAVAPAEGLVPASGVAAGVTAWWRTSIGTAVGFNIVTGGVEVVMCPGDNGHWEIGSVGNRLHCAVLAGNDVAVFRHDGQGWWEEAARVGVVEVLQSWTPEPVYEDEECDDHDEAEHAEEDKEPNAAAEEGAGEEERQPNAAAEEGAEQEEQQPNVAAEAGAEEEEQQPNAATEEGAEEEEQQPNVAAEAGAEEEEQQPNAATEEGAEEEEQQPNVATEEGAEEEEQQPNVAAEAGAEEEEQQPNAATEEGAEEEEQQPNVATEEGAEEDEQQPRAIVAVANRLQELPNYDVRLLPFQGAEVEVVVLSGKHVVAFDTVTRRRRTAAMPDPPRGRDWRDAEYVAHTNTLALVAPALLAREPAGITEPPDDREDASSSA